MSFSSIALSTFQGVTIFPRNRALHYKVFSSWQNLWILTGSKCRHPSDLVKIQFGRLQLKLRPVMFKQSNEAEKPSTKKHVSLEWKAEVLKSAVHLQIFLTWILLTTNWSTQTLVSSMLHFAKHIRYLFVSITLWCLAKLKIYKWRGWMKQIRNPKRNISNTNSARNKFVIHYQHTTLK